MQEEAFLLRHFREFYSKNSINVPAVEEREFGTGIFGKKIAKRHLSFPSVEALNSYLRENVPFFISHSLAYYQYPERTPMHEKGFMGADIVYEFDADDLKTDCKREHDSWHCLHCGEKDNGSIDSCPKCGFAVQKEQWFCPRCLDETKKQALRLVDFIENDFGLHDGISVNFSGNAGYHVHLRGNNVRFLSQEARLEMLDYLTAKDIDLRKYGFVESGKMFLCPLPGEAKGWGKRLLHSLDDLLSNGSLERIAALGGIPYAKARELLSNRELVLRTMMEKGILFSIPGRKNREFWESLLKHLTEFDALGIDRQTSIDISKIIRVPDTLHGGTGLIAKTIPLAKLKDFNPLDDAVAFPSNGVKIFINSSPKFYLKGSWFGPFSKEEAEMPLHAAIYLIARNSAKLVG